MKPALLATCFVASINFSVPCLASEPGSEDAWIQVGAYVPDVSTRIRVESPSSNIPATTVNFEDDLSFPDRKTLPSVTLGARLGSNWRVIGDFYRLGRTREASLASEVVFDDVVYPVNASVKARFNSDVYRLTIGYSIVKQDDVEAGLALGAHTTDFEVSLAGNGSVGGAAASFQERRRKVFAPMPTLGAYLDWRPASKLTLAVRADALKLKLGDYKGRLLNLQASAAYAVTRSLSLGAMWRHVSYRIDVSKSDWSGQVRYRFAGPQVFAEYRF